MHFSQTLVIFPSGDLCPGTPTLYQNILDLYYQHLGHIPDDV